MKTFVKLFLILCLAINIAGCEQNTKNKTEIEFWTLQLNNFAPYINNKISKYEKNHPNIKIKWIDIPFSEGEKRTLSAVMSKNTPDVINLNPSFASTLQKKNALRKIESNLAKNYIPCALKLCQNNGIFFAIPWYVTSPITIYNKEILQNTGFRTPPKNHKELIEFAFIIKKTTEKYAFMPTLAEDGAMLKIISKQNIDINDFTKSPKTIEIYNIYKNLYKNNLIPKGSINQTHRESLEKYMAGQTAFLEAGANFLKIIKENAPQIYKNTGICPQMELQNDVIQISLMNLVIPKKSKHPKIAEDFALFITNPGNQLEFCKLAPVLPSTKRSLEDSFFNENSSLIDKGRKISAKQLRQSKNTQEIKPNQKQINQIIDYTTQNIILEKQSIQEALDNCRKKLNSI